MLNHLKWEFLEHRTKSTIVHVMFYKVNHMYKVSLGQLRGQFITVPKQTPIISPYLTMEYFARRNN